MADPFVGEIRFFAGQLAPANWALCDGSLLPISEYETLFTLVGTTYGGNGVTTFGLPDLRGRIPIHTSQNYPLGTLSGSEQVPLSQAQIPAHTHLVQCSSVQGTVGAATNAFYGPNQINPTTKVPVDLTYFPGPTPNTPMASGVITPSGKNVPHDNVQPFLVINYIIALAGIFPSQG